MKKNILFIFSILIVISFISLTSAICCEKTDEGAYCQDVIDIANCDDGYRISENQACEVKGSFCSSGTCVDRNTGDCVESPQATCNTSLGGYWYDKNMVDVAECQLGCCILGDGASFIERVTCDTLGSDYGITSEYHLEITDSASCFELAGQQKKGACVFQSALGRDCDISKV